jgi:asparagine synthetase B (glutamine-hydrolysing)
VNGNIVCLYNGEIYNQPYQTSDGEVLIPLYKHYGEDFIRHLDGEFAIALFDFDNHTAIFSTDAFRTKPIWGNEYGVASYKSGIGDGGPLAPNTTMIRDLKTGKEKIQTVYDFDFSVQHKSHYDDWINAFEQAIKKRGRDDCFIASPVAMTAVQSTVRSSEPASNISRIRSSVLKIRRASQRNTVLPFTQQNFQSEQATSKLCGTLRIYHLWDQTLCDGRKCGVGLGFICRLATLKVGEFILQGRGG